jgi:hypothetical protein
VALRALLATEVKSWCRTHHVPYVPLDPQVISSMQSHAALLDACKLTHMLASGRDVLSQHAKGSRPMVHLHWFGYGALRRMKTGQFTPLAMLDRIMRTLVERPRKVHVMVSYATDKTWMDMGTVATDPQSDFLLDS